MITISQKGNFSNLSNFFERAAAAVKLSKLDKYGRLGVDALSAATPVDTGETAASWSYEIERGENSTSLIFKNSNVTDQGDPIAILLQYGHATGNGGYVKGIDYINPALRPIFEQIANEAWQEVSQ